MQCTNGHDNEADAKFCATCGTDTFSPDSASVPTFSPSATANATVTPNAKAPSLAVAALVLGIIGLLIFPILFSTLAIIFGAMTRQKLVKGASGYGMAVAGLGLGIIGLAVWILLIATR